MVSDNSGSLLEAAIAGAGIILTPDWLASHALRDGALVPLLPDWHGSENGGIYAVIPPCRMVPNKTRVFFDEISATIRVGWDR